MRYNYTILFNDFLYLGGRREPDWSSSRFFVGIKGSDSRRKYIIYFYFDYSHVFIGRCGVGERIDQESVNFSLTLCVDFFELISV